MTKADGSHASRIIEGQNLRFETPDRRPTELPPIDPKAPDCSHDEMRRVAGTDQLPPLPTHAP